ncbi:MAG: hypothetical protein AAFV07_01115 [Bacteroidota bacterium]
MHRLPYITVLVILLAACQPAQKLSDTSAKAEASVLKTANRHASRMDQHTFDWFLSVAENGDEMPPALIEKHTMLAKAYGSYRAIEVREVNPEIKALVLRQSGPLCTYHFLLTTDGKKVLDQMVIGEDCGRSPAQEVYEYADYRFTASDAVAYRTVRQEWDGEQPRETHMDHLLFSIQPDGKITADYSVQ